MDFLKEGGGKVFFQVYYGKVFMQEDFIEGRRISSEKNF